MGDAREGLEGGTPLWSPSKHEAMGWFLFAPLWTQRVCVGRFSPSTGVEGIQWAVSHPLLLLMGNLKASKSKLDKG